ncbi:MAG: hypothetical protein V4492_00815 [Chlamydiota bacterium]
MKSRKTKKAIKTYGMIGKALCACAGGIVGFVLGGPIFAIPGIFVGLFVGHLLEKSVISSIA